MPVQLESACTEQLRDLLPLWRTQPLPPMTTFSILLCLTPTSQCFSLAAPGRPGASSNSSAVTLGENQSQT